MSEEEIIDYLKEIIQEIEYRHKAGELILVNDITTDKLYYSIKGLLDLYNKEKEKNKKLIDGQIETIEKILAPKLLEKFIIKDKINEKIEEYEEILDSPIIKDDYKREVEHIIRVLEELKGDN